jgi:myo-inositol-1(or 4)-monophosphatase
MTKSDRGIVSTSARENNPSVSASPIATARELAREAGGLIAAALGGRRSVERKSAVDLVTEIDLASERLIVEGLRRAFPEHDVVAEESAPARQGTGRNCWYVDPLDGTTNFVHGLPHCCVSLALAGPNGSIEAAVVFDPCKNEMFEAVRGSGARLNGATIRASCTAKLDDALLVTGFPYDRREDTGFYLKYFEAFLRRSRDVRRFGSAALDLSYVAAGRFDGFWEWGLKPWDTAAGWLIVEEAGGLVTDFDGAPYDPWSPRILATAPNLHDEVVRVLESVGGKDRS